LLQNKRAEYDKLLIQLDLTLQKGKR
jgi:hypothetical protein